MELNIKEIKKQIDTNLVEGTDIEEKFDELIKVISNEVELSKLFVTCFSILKINELSELDNFLKEYAEINNKLVNELKDYENGDGYGDWAIKERIKGLVLIYKYKLIKFLVVFKNLFIE